ncbi:MAG TPA: oxygen-independent coproporphyrinogen III oxidase, partial [Thermoanaerobaculia bacterium]
LYPLGRGHGRAQALEAAGAAVQSGGRVNLDLIIGLPNQTMESFATSLATALDLGVGHLSLYMLDLEEGTKLKLQAERGQVVLPDDAQVAAMYERAIAIAGARGLHQYEISNFARVGEESRHNLRYWRRLEYRGFGLGAHSFAGERREANTRDIGEYIDRLSRGESPVVFVEELGEAERKHERIFLALRQSEGIAERDLLDLCGKEGAEWSRRGLEEGWLQRIDRHFAFTTRGFLLSNDYIAQLF